MAGKATLKRLYGLTIEQYDAMLVLQDGRCAICNRRPLMAQPDLAVDHDHVTGKVRGLLCGRCNHDLLGIFGDDPGFYMRAEEYLTRNPADQAITPTYIPGSPGAEGELP
jgi:hypothetical protein